MVGIGPAKGNNGSFNFAIQNLEEVNNQLNTLSRYIDDLRVPLTIIAADFYRSERGIFSLQSAGRYKDLSPEYKKRKALPRDKGGAGFVYPILVGRTRKLATSVLGANNEGSIYRLTKNSLTIGTSIPYAKYHQSDAARSKMPLRKFLFIDGGSGDRNIAGRRARWISIISDHINQEINNRWG